MEPGMNSGLAGIIQQLLDFSKARQGETYDPVIYLRRLRTKAKFSIAIVNPGSVSVFVNRFHNFWHEENKFFNHSATLRI